MKLLRNYCISIGIKTHITVGVVGKHFISISICNTNNIGLPNVGKSSIINSLKRNKVCSVGATPGITK